VCGPLQYNPDKTVQSSCFRWYGLFTPLYRRTPIGGLKFAKKDLDRFLMKDYNKIREKEVDWLLGSFLFCRTKALERIGLFDEKFFLYLEDTDLCQRFWSDGWKVVFYPEAKIIHNHNRQSAKIVWYKFFMDQTSRHHFVSWYLYLRKWGIK
ncbi:MAG: glycosyltransferase, partial [Candidatus Azambacteria bacterium]|nr:glycosyltransferase [Candidatus Azambacteria bacterium]